MFKTPADALLTDMRHLALKEARRVEQKLMDAQQALGPVDASKSSQTLHALVAECLEKIRERIDILQEEVLLCHTADSSGKPH